MRHFYLLPVLLLTAFISKAQVEKQVKVDTAVVVATKGNFSTNEFIQLVREDTSFYKAFKNLHYYPYKIIAVLAVLDRDNDERATLSRIGKQHVMYGLKWMEITEEKTTGKIYKRNGKYNYYTAELLDHIFFPHDTSKAVNAIGNYREQLKGNNENDKNKEKLKALIFNPGAAVEGVPLIGKKLSIFDDDMLKYYDYKVELASYNDSLHCYKFSVKAKQPGDDHAVIKELISYFDRKTFNIVARRYVVSYHSAPFDFDVVMEVKLELINNVIVPVAISYNGYWDVVFKKSEYVNFRIKFSDYGIQN